MRSRTSWSLARIALVIVVVLLAVTAAPTAIRLVGLERPISQVVPSAIAFGLMVSLVVDPWSRSPISVRGLTRAILHLLAAAAVAMLALMLLGRWSAALTPLLAVLAPAAIEEGVFRRALPLRLTALLKSVSGLSPGRARFLADVIAQLLFAACHFVSRDSLWASRGATEATRLFASGTFYANVTRRCGLWLAIGTHAALNMSLRSSDSLLPRRVGLPTAALCALIGLYGLISSPHFPPSRATTA